MMSIDTFRVNVPEHTLDDSPRAAEADSLTNEIDDGWTLGTNNGALHALVDYWTGEFDWRRQEEAINRFGFGFSGKPTTLGAIFHLGDLWHTLMAEVLGYVGQVHADDRSRREVVHER